LTPSFTIERPGEYVVQLIVNDGYVDSAPDTVVVTTTNSAPVADAGANQSVLVGDTVTLDGGGSRDADGDALTYRWSLTVRPAGSLAAISDAAAVSPTFVADRAGTYVAQLIVSDGTVDSAPDTVTITTDNRAPIASAGADRTVVAGDTVTLDGSGSSDPDGDAIAFEWAIVTRPAGSGATLSDPAAQSPTFVADRGGDYVVQLVVSDGTLASAPDTVTITAQVSVPNVVGLQQAAAEAAITGARLAVGTVTFQTSDTVPEGEVISQAPVGGTIVAADSAVDLVVSSGTGVPVL
jgi:hypothetical protein